MLALEEWDERLGERGSDTSIYLNPGIWLKDDDLVRNF